MNESITRYPSLRRAAVVSVAAASLVWAACSGAQRSGASVAAGQACEASSECRGDLVCKGAVCAPAQSVSGGVCVTDRGCEDGLRCLGGRCSEGLAPASTCANACQHVRRLMRADLERDGAEYASAAEEALVRVALVDFETRCRERCDSRTTVEQASCLASAASIEQVQDCP